MMGWAAKPQVVMRARRRKHSAGSRRRLNVRLSRGNRGRSDFYIGCWLPSCKAQMEGFILHQRDVSPSEGGGQEVRTAAYINEDVVVGTGVRGGRYAVLPDLGLSSRNDN